MSPASRGARAVGQSGFAQGRCPVCGQMKRLLSLSGKLVSHTQVWRGPVCEGSYQPPARVDRRTGEAVTGGTVVGFRPGDDGPSAVGDPGEQEVTS